MDRRPRRAAPLWKAGHISPEGGVINLVDDDPEERCGLVTRVGLELRVDLDDKCGRHSGK